MAKRVADSQITRETLREDSSDSDNENGPSSTKHGVASASVMNRRRIAMPKKKAAGGFNFQPKPFSLDSNNKPSAESQMSNAFNIFKQPQPSNNSNDDTNTKIKALNIQFKNKVIEVLNGDSFADLSPALDKYKQYIEPLKSVNNITQSVSQPSLPTKADEGQVNEKKENESASEDEKEVAVEGPKFTLQSKPNISNSVFSFGGKKEEPKKRSSESDSEDEIEVKGPQFTFSGEVKSDFFKLNRTAEQKQEKPPQTANPFQLKNSEPSKPAFSFGSMNNNNNDNDNTKKPSFGFGQGNTQNESPKKPTFTFGQQKTQEPPKKPSFNFSFKPNAPTSASDSTGNKNDNKPSFSFKFGEQKPQQDSQAEKPKPSFSFGNPTPATNGENKSDTKPAFSFGSSNSSTAPSFSFPKPDNTNNNSGTATINANGNPSGGFKFSLPFSQKPASQPSPSPTLSAPVQGTVDSKPEENEEEPSKSVELQNGEENENALFSQRSKLMVFNGESRSYDSRGLGELKLLQSKEDKSKVRLLCRSDGMGNILLNTSLVKSFTYSPLTAENDNLIKLPAVEAQGKLVTYVAKFKQKSDGQLLVKSIEDVKKDM